MQRAEDQVTRQCCANGDFCRLKIAHFSDHHDVRVAAQNAAEACGKSQINLRTDGDLDDARQLVFHRIFNGDNASVLRIELGKEGVKRRGLAGASRPGYQHDAVGLFQ